MPTPSLLIVPARFKTGKLYSQIPTSGAGDFTVTRNTTATRLNSAGLLESVASGIPRLDYYTSGGVTGCPALLVEPSAQNLVPSGTNVGGDAGVSRTATITSPAVDISGTIIAKTVTGTTNLFASQACLTSLPAGSTTYTISRFFKYNGTDLTTSLENNVSTQWGGTSWIQRVVISAASGVTLGTSTACTGSVDNYGNGWYRVSARFTTGATPSGSTNVSYLMIVSGSVASGSSFLTALPQLETGSVATSYIPTPAGSASRSADVISVSGAVSGSIGQTEGTMYWEGAIYRYDRVFFALSSGTSTTQAVRLQTTGAGLLQAISISGTVQANPQTSGAVTLGQFNKVAFAYKENDFVLYVNGVLQASDTSGTLPTNLNSVYFCNSNGTEITDQRCRAAAIYTTRLTNAELAALTAP